MIRCMIVEDFEPLREAYGQVLSAEPDIEVVDSFENGSRLLARLQACAAGGMPADVVLLDVEMESRKDGIEVCKTLSHQYPAIKCIMLTCHDEEPLIVEALEGGAVNYLSKTSSPEQIVAAIRSAKEGESSFDAGISEKLRNYLQNAPKYRQSLLFVMNNMAKLTVSEAEILRMSLAGKTKLEIADERAVEFGTIKTQIGSILKKFGCTRMSQVVQIIKELDLQSFLLEEE